MNDRYSAGSCASGKRSSDLSALIDDTCEVAPAGSAAAEQIVSRLENLAGRLKAQRLQLAVLGQFKRGKSTLLNALLGAAALPMAVTPLTAIPTFIAFGENLHLRTVGIEGATDDIPVADIETLHAELKARVTEESNPHNRLGLARVEVRLPSDLLRKGVVLIDTPGVGSTYLHNTETAQAVLPECDAALFVVSPDPPIMAAELDYLGRIRATAPRVILVLNKIDIVEGEDRSAAVEFLRRVAEHTPDLKDAPLFCVSARMALRARLAGDAEALRTSGIAALESYLNDFIKNEKLQALESAIAQKARTLVDELKFDVESRLAALRMPIDQLSERLEKFDRAAARFEAERNASIDLIAGDRRRLLAERDADAERLYSRMAAVLTKYLDEAVETGNTETTVSAALVERIPVLFEAESHAHDAGVRRRFVELLRTHQQRADALIADVRHTAANLLQIDYAAPAAEEAFELRRIPYWVTRPREALRLLPPGTVETLMPSPARKRRMRKRLADQLNEILRRNVENLRWSMRQNLEDGFRAFETRLDEQLKLTLSATREALQLGLQRRTEKSESAETETGALVAASTRLRDIRNRLDSMTASREDGHGHGR
jgi:ribosome biogenesis GTPase A